MAFASGAVSYQRFFISGKPLGVVDDRFVAALQEYAFGRRGSADADVQMGWITSRHLFDNEILGEKVALGRFALLGLRIDSLKPPASILRSYVQMEVDAEQRATGRAFLNKAERQRARDKARLRLEQEARGGSFRRTTGHTLLIDLENNILLLGSLGASVADRLTELFGNTFHRALEPVHADALAQRILGTRTRTLEQLLPFQLVPPPEPVDAEDRSAVVDVAFLGREFLTWLWFLTDTQRTDVLKLRAGDQVAVMIDRSMRLECPSGATGTVSLAADGPASMPEARAALMTGKLPTRLGLLLGSPAGEFSLTLDGARMAVSSLTVPEAADKRDPRLLLEERCEQVLDCTTLLDALFELFLRVRTAASWNATLAEMRSWALGAAARARRAVTA